MTDEEKRPARSTEDIGAPERVTEPTDDMSPFEAASYFFYGSWDWRFCFLLAFTTVAEKHDLYLVGKAARIINHRIDEGVRMAKAKIDGASVTVSCEAFDLDKTVMRTRATKYAGTINDAEMARVMQDRIILRLEKLQ